MIFLSFRAKQVSVINLALSDLNIFSRKLEVILIFFQCHCGHINCPCCNLLMNLEITDPNLLQWPPFDQIDFSCPNCPPLSVCILGNFSRPAHLSLMMYHVFLRLYPDLRKNIHRCARRWSCWNTSDIWAKCQRLGSAFYMSKMSQTSFLSDVKFSEWKTWASKLWFQLKTHCNDGQIEGYSSYHSHSAVERKSNWATHKGFANGRWAGQKKDQKLSHR